MTKKWREDGSFCRWIISKQYARFDNGKVSPFMTEAQVIYMWEAWRGGIDDERRGGLSRRGDHDDIVQR